MGEIIVGTGIDVIEVDRIAKAILRQKFVTRVYSSYERTYLAHRSAPSWAARFAAKEAVMKAIGYGWRCGVGFADIEVRADEWGKPEIVLAGKAGELATAQGIMRFLVSLSHTKSYAVASVVAVGKERSS